MADVEAGKGRYKVTGAAAVVRTLDGSERYLYRGAVFDAQQVVASNIEHLVGVGLITAQGAAASGSAKVAAAKK